MIKLSRGARLTIALYAPLGLCCLISPALFILGFVWPAVYVAATGAVWVVIGAALWLLFEPTMAHAIGAPIAYEDEE